MPNLKHLLNDDTDFHSYPAHRPPLPWLDSGYFDDYENDAIPALPAEPWDQFVGNILGPEFLSVETDSIALDSQTLSDTQLQVEEWALKNSEQLASGPESPTEHILTCYGTIFHAAVKLCGDMAEIDKRLSCSPASPVQGHSLLQLSALDNHFFVTFFDTLALGEVNASLEKALKKLSSDHFRLEFEVFIPIRAVRETIQRAQQVKEAVVRAQINVYGLEHAAAAVGTELSANKIYLQRPDYVKDGLVYSNPHILKVLDCDREHIEIVAEFEEPSTCAVPEVSLKENICKIYSSLTRNQNLIGLEGDERLRTPLLDHQKRALDFMTQRENGPIPISYRLWQSESIDGERCYRHTVTKARCHVEPPEETGGGILADEMGMGKSLSVLALILRTLDTAHSWTIQADECKITMLRSQVSKPRSSATLIVASSDLMINEWFLELDKHFTAGTRTMLTTVKYHGQKRERSIEMLCNADMVITTYHTLASEVSDSKSPINDIEWYRLVLDEAHIIRRQTTGLYRTVAKIPARSRWCLTGTPIQNKLEDLGSLLAFLRLEPFHNLATFRRFIALPYDEPGKSRTSAIERFTRLLDSVCLRRTKDLLDLPDPQNVTRILQLSKDERHQYEQTRKTMFRAVRHQNGMLDQKSTLGMFQVQLQLRILCNHGTWQQPFSWNRSKLHLLDEREALETSLGRGGEATCSACRQTMPLFGAGTSFQRYDDCRHFLCSECIEDNAIQDHEATSRRCPLCRPLWKASAGTFLSEHPPQEDMYFRTTGISTKMLALLSDVMTHVLESKSIIFTCWTRTLDLIEVYLKWAELDVNHFRRIDGDCPTAKREKILDDFAHNSDLRVLIMTTGTGAVGLNLATANRVFIVEPQWNPSVENQAIARALRIGQEKAVTVTRYVVDQTVEQDMRSLQDKKMERANLVKVS